MAEGQAMQAKRPLDPEERLRELYEELSHEAYQLENYANEYQDQMLMAQARAAGLRTGAAGVQAALERFQEEAERAQAIRHERDGDAQKDPIDNASLRRLNRAATEKRF